MDKQTKNILTRASLTKELLFLSTANIRYSIVLCCVVLLVEIPIIALVAALTDKHTFAITISVATILSVIPGIFIYCIIQEFKDKKRIERGEYDVITRQVIYKHESRIARPGCGHRIEELLHFDTFGDIGVAHLTYQLADEGDVFYLVCLHTSKKPTLLYSAEMYEFRE